MFNAQLGAWLFRAIMAAVCFSLGAEAWAVASGSGIGIGGMAANVTSNVANMAKLVTAGSYVAGMAFAVGAIAKFKQHKDNPQQMPLSTPIVLLFVGAALIFIPAIFKSGGETMFGAGAQKSSVTGMTTFGSGT